jgi:hypothetical protein
MLVCIDNEGSENNLTINKKYIVIEAIFFNKKECVVVLDDNNSHFFCHSNRFKNLSEIRDEKINKIIKYEF